MRSKSGASKKRTNPIRDVLKTRQFLKDWDRLSTSGRYDLNRLNEAMLLLVSGNSSLGPEWLDHPLSGEWQDHRECHVGGDFLLIYRFDMDGKTEKVVFVRAGTHSELFR